jgi:eukaryotic-like serine/threonine-protein kinase
MLKLTSLLGKGGMGSVWLGEHFGLGTTVVVKFLADEHASNEEAVTRFKREAAASIQVKSPHVVQVFDHGVTQWGAPYIVMERLEGQDLGKVLANGPLPPREVAEIVRQVARALSRAHPAGVVHRDLKPDNIFLCDAGEGEAFVKILDFGIAKVNDKLSAKTQTGAVFGTPFYMSPEQILGTGTDPTTDLWSLAVVAFEALTGKRPFEGETVGAVTLAIHTTKPTPRKHKPLLPQALDAWFEKAFAKEKVNRHASAKELADTFAEAISGAASAPAVISFRAPMASMVDESSPSISAHSSSPPAMGSTQLASTTGLNVGKREVKRERKMWPFVAGGSLLLGAVAAFALRGSGTPAKVDPVKGAAPPSSVHVVPPVREDAPIPQASVSAPPAPSEEAPTFDNPTAPAGPGATAHKGAKLPQPVIKTTGSAKSTSSPRPTGSYGGDIR